MAAWSAPAAAHPLGNFTTNRFARVLPGAEVVRVQYVLDEAELVAFRQRDAVTAEGPDAFAARRAAEIGGNLRLMIAGREVRSLAVADLDFEQPPGQGGLSTLRLEVLFEAPIPAGLDGPLDVRFADENQPDRIGWREIVVVPASGARLQRSSVPATSRSDDLRRYPENPTVGSLDVRSADFSFTPGLGADGPATLDRLGRSGESSTGDRFVGLLDRTTSSPLAIGGALLVALAFGAVHAVGPGHGKTVMAAYLVSTRGRRRDAFALGTIVSLMHTASVLALAAVLATVGRDLDAARLYPVLTLVAGAFIVIVGLRLVFRRWQARLDRHAHRHPHGAAREHAHTASAQGGVAVLDRPAHEHDHHVHDHDDHHGHVHGPGTHTHELPPDVRPLSRAGLVALGTSGGLFPSPSAVVVLLGAFAAGRAALGLALIAAFSVGLAAVLVAVGLVLVAGRERLLGSRFAVRLPWLQVAGAVAIVVLGVVLLVQGITQLA